MQETSFSAGAPDEPTAAGGHAPLLSKYPHLAEMVSAAARPGNDYADAFDSGLDLILEALDRRRDDGS